MRRSPVRSHNTGIIISLDDEGHADEALQTETGYGITIRAEINSRCIRPPQKSTCSFKMLFVARTLYISAGKRNRKCPNTR